MKQELNLQRELPWRLIPHLSPQGNVITLMGATSIFKLAKRSINTAQTLVLRTQGGRHITCHLLEISKYDFLLQLLPDFQALLPLSAHLMCPLDH